MNSKDQLDFLRDNVGEATSAYWSDLNLLRRLNMGQSRTAVLVAQHRGQWLIKSASVTPVDSVITLPADCSKPVYLEETSSRTPISWLSGVAYRSVSRGTGTLLGGGYGEAYPLQSTIEVNKSSYTTACTLWYQIRVPDLHCGHAQSGSAASTLEMDDATVAASGTSLGVGRALSFVDDYYNGVTIEVIDKTSLIVDIRSAVTDYVASTHKLTITGTPEDTDVYGTVSLLPPETHQLIVAEATVLALMKPDSQIDKEVIAWYRRDLRELRKDVDEWLETRIIEGTGVEVGDPWH